MTLAYPGTPSKAASIERALREKYGEPLKTTSLVPCRACTSFRRIWNWLDSSYRIATGRIIVDLSCPVDPNSPILIVYFQDERGVARQVRETAAPRIEP